MIEQLKPFIGKWKTSGKVYNDDGFFTNFSGSDTYEWLPNQHFILHTVNVMMGNEQNLATEILGVGEADNFFVHAYEMDGSFSKMIATNKNGEWIFIGDQARYTGRFNNNRNTMSGTWEKKNKDGTWQKWMDILLEK